MGCGSCGSGGCGTKGCGSSGGCSSGGCNRLNTHNWLSNLPKADFGKPYDIIEVSFNNGSRKDFYKNTTLGYFDKGDMIAVESSLGFDVGAVTLTGEIVKLQMAKKGVKESSEDIRRVLRKATTDDIEKLKENKPREQTILIRARAIIKTLKLEMKLTEVEVQADGKKATFFYIAEDRVDFRELIRVYATDFRVKVEMKQIGIRQEAAKVGGIGSCGRELCCSTWLTDFKAVSTLAARYQNLSINQTKLSGQCGRLKCCLNYELDTYMDALQHFPNAEKLEMANGMAYLAKKDIFKNLMWYSLSGSNKQYPLTIERVLEIKNLNSKGIKPEELGAVELEKKDSSEISDAYVDLTGAISLRSLDKKNKGRNTKGPQRPSNNRGGAPSGNRPQHTNAPAGEGNAPRNQGPRPQGEGNAPRNQGPRPQGEGNAPRNQGPRPQGAGNNPRNQGPRPNTRPAPSGVEGAPGPQNTQGQVPPTQGANPNAQGARPQRQQGPRPPRPQQNNPNREGQNADKPNNPNPNPNQNNEGNKNPNFKSDFGGKKPPKSDKAE